MAMYRYKSKTQRRRELEYEAELHENLSAPMADR